MLIVALLALAVAGCSAPSATPTAHPTDTTPSGLPTQTAPTPTPGPNAWLSGFTEYDINRVQPFINGVTSDYEAVYHTANWTMPDSIQTQYGYAHYGCVYRLLFTNPTGDPQQIVAGDTVKSDVTYVDQRGYRGYVYTSDVFYDPATKSQYGTVNLAPGDSKEVYMFTYITNDSAYATWGPWLDPKPGLDVNPHYFELPH